MKYYEKIQQVYQAIAPYIRKTPMLSSAFFSANSGSGIVFKCENLQYTNSFKVRGAFNKILSLPDKNKVLVAASGGNHGLAVAYAGKQFGMMTIVVVFETTAQYRIDLIRALGAEVIRYGRTMDDLNAKVSEYIKDDRYVYIHPFSDDEVIAGQATIAYELLHQESDMDAIVVSIGGGGLISGVSQYAKSFNPQIKVYGVETEGADSMYQSLKAGKIVALPAITSIATSLGATKVTEKTFSIVRNYVDEVVTVTDAETIHALKDILTHEKLLVEPASSCSLAAVLSGKLPDLANKKVAVILCGGSFSLEQLKQYL